MYHKWRSYNIWLVRYKACQTEFFVILGHFLPFEPANNLKNQSFEEMKKTPEDIILHLHTINDDHMMHMIPQIWSTTEFFIILGYFLPFSPTKNPKNHNFRKWKKTLDISSSYTAVPKIMIICYTVPDIWHVMDVIIFHFGHFLPF